MYFSEEALAVLTLGSRVSSPEELIIVRNPQNVQQNQKGKTQSQLYSLTPTRM